MTNLMQASHQWMSRPDDQRFTSLLALGAFTRSIKGRSKAVTVSSRKLRAIADTADHKGVTIEGPNGKPATMTHWSFGQMAALAGAPAGYLRKLPAELVADCLNYGLQVSRGVEDVGVLLRKPEDYPVSPPMIAAATGPNYGRIWDADIADMFVERFGDGVTGSWRVPGEFRQRVSVTKENTTLYASDRDMWVYLADEDHPIELPNRRANRHGTFARGFFAWNSEVGDATCGAAFFLYDETCCNRIVWNIEQFREVRIRHTAGGPDRWMHEIVPVLNEFAHAKAAPIVEALENARKAKIAGDLDKFLASRFGGNRVESIKKAHEVDEGRPIETVWDAVTGATTFARSIPHQDIRVALERDAGKLLVRAAA